MNPSPIPPSMIVPRFVGQGCIEFVQKPVPEPGPGQLLIRVKANALCGSERGQFLHGSEVTPGHEAAGIVCAAGSGTHTPLGTAGVVFLMDFCGTCRSCRLGLTNQCLHKRGDMGFNRDGGYGVFELVHESIFFPIPADIPLTDSTLLLDVMGTSSHALKRAQHVHGDIQSVVVMGAGPVGLGVLAMTKIRLGSDVPVFITDVLPYRLELAVQFGGIPVHLPEHTLADELQHAGLGTVDLAIDTSGKGAARQMGLEVLGQRGVLVCVGHGEDLNLTVSRDLIAPERAVLGSEYFCFAELPETLEQLRAHHAYLRQIITHRYPVHDLQHAFEVFFGGATGKVVIEQ